MESLFITPAISNLLFEGKIFQIPVVMRMGWTKGQRLMNEVLMDLKQSKK